MDPNNAWQAYYNRFGGQEQGMVGNPASLLLAHQQLREAANQVGHLSIWETPEKRSRRTKIWEIHENMGTI